MVLEVTLPFGVLNALPGVSGVQDETLRIPQTDDIQDIVDSNTLDFQDVVTAVTDAVDDLDTTFSLTDDAIQRIVDQVVQEIEQATGIDFPDAEEIAQAFIDLVDPGDILDIKVDVGGSLFDVEEDFVELLASALELVDFFDLSGFPSLQEVESLIDDIRTDLEELDLDSLGDLQAQIENAIIQVLADIPGGDLLLSPDTFIDDQIQRVTDGLVSEEAREELQSQLENR